VRLVNLIWCRSVRGDVGTRFLASRKSHADTWLCAHYERPQWQLSPRPCAGAAEKFAWAARLPESGPGRALRDHRQRGPRALHVARRSARSRTSAFSSVGRTPICLIWALRARSRTRGSPTGRHARPRDNLPGNPERRRRGQRRARSSRSFFA